MATCGYLVGSDINSTKLIHAPVLEKIHLTPSRSKFIVVGTKDSIFDWMENYGKLVCEFNQIPQTQPSNQLDHTTNELTIITLNTDPIDPIIITFKLYEDHKHNNILKSLLSPGSPKMRMEIHALNQNEDLPLLTSTPVMEANGYNGVKLYQVLDKWKNRKLNLERRACDFE